MFVARYLFVFLFNILLICSVGNAQDEEVVESKKYGQLKKYFIKTNVIAPGAGFEYILSSQTTLCFETHMGINFNDYTIDYLNFRSFTLFVSSSLSFRYYYNLYKRYHNGIDVNGLSANYVTFIVSYRYPIHPITHHVALSPAWGIQRRIKRMGNIDISFGPAIVVLFGDRALAFGGYLGLGFCF